MNKHRFRLIFSKKLGFLIPVAEINNSQRKPGQTNGPSIASAEIPSVDWTLKPLPGVIRCMQQALVRVVLRGAIAPIFAITCVPGMAAADMIVDPNAAPGQRATLNQAPNGVPVIEIANPNANGLSHNRFQEFDVQKPGVIFNNSTKDGTSQIGGFIPKNTNLSQQAKAILTEVTGTNPSSLSGTLEVFGGKADLLIAKKTYMRLVMVTISRSLLQRLMARPKNSMSLIRLWYNCCAPVSLNIPPAWARLGRRQPMKKHPMWVN